MLIIESNEPFYSIILLYKTNQFLLNTVQSLKIINSKNINELFIFFATKFLKN